MFDVFKKDKFEMQRYMVYDPEQERTREVQGMVHNKSKLAIRKTKTMGYVIDILVEEDILYAHIYTEQIAKDIVMDQRIQAYNWKKVGMKEEILESKIEKEKILAVKTQYNKASLYETTVPKYVTTNTNIKEVDSKKNKKNTNKEIQQNNNEQKKTENNKPNNKYKKVDYSKLKIKDMYVHKEKDKYQVKIKLTEDSEQIIATGIKTEEGAYQIKKLLEAMYDWKKYEYPRYLRTKTASGKFVKENIDRVNRGENVIMEFSNEVIIEMFFSAEQRIKERYPIYKEGMQELQGMIGLKKVKNQIDDLSLQLVGRRKRGLPLENTGMHMVFSGPAGTGKTVVANIVAKILYALGYLDNDKVVKATRDVLVGEHIGSSEKKTMQKIEEAMGGVLFIDEAYSLYRKGSTSDFGIDVVNILIKEMEDRRSEFVVILAGYENEMAEMITMNPGLKSRIKNKIDFEDYSYSELIKISEALKDKSLQAPMTKEAKNYFGKVLENQMQSGKLDGNARTVRVMLETISTSYFADVGRNKAGKEVAQKDIEKVYKLENKKEEKNKLENVMKKLNQLYGLEELKASIDKFAKMVQWERRKEEHGMGKFEMDRMHMAFMGPAGTAKTTVAEIMGEFLTSVGLLKTNKVVTATRKDLVGEYVGQTAPKVKNIIDRAMGGVLFIDEAYSLVNGEQDTFGNEAVTELIAAMEKYKSDFVVILAGYQGDVEKLLRTNEGFNSRIAHKFIFDAYKADDIYNIMMMKFKQNGYVVNEEAQRILKEKLNEYAQKNNGKFDGNGRWADNQVARMKHIKIEVSERRGKTIEEMTKEDMIRVTKDEIERWYETI